MSLNINHDNQIEQVMKTALSSIKELADVNTVIGQPYTTLDGTTIIPISKVTIGFLSGGGEYGDKKNKIEPNFPMSAGSGGYTQLAPIGFLVGQNGDMKLINIDGTNAYGKLIDAAVEFLSSSKVKQ
ncbi:MAG: spore germination protein GerW family protein [Clostridia bacterium]